MGFGIQRKGSLKVFIISSWVIKHDILPCCLVSSVTKPKQKVHRNGLFPPPIWLREPLILKIEVVIDFI